MQSIYSFKYYKKQSSVLLTTAKQKRQKGFHIKKRKKSPFRFHFTNHEYCVNANSTSRNITMITPTK